MGQRYFALLNSTITAIFLITWSFVSCQTTNKPDVLVGEYTGYLELNGKRRPTSFKFFEDNGRQIATASTPSNLQLDQPFNSVRYNPPYIELTMRDGTGILELNGKIENDVFTGKVSGELPAVVRLEKNTNPQTLPKNYTVEPLTIAHGSISLPANLYLPKSVTKTGAVIMICGSGPHVKEEYNGWADLLASKGIAVLTYDKRNVTDFPSLNIRSRSSDIVLPGELESDIEAAIRLVKGRSEIDNSKIGLIGFSQGAVMAPIVAAGNADVAFVVAISGNTTTDKEFIIYQSLNRLRMRNIDQSRIDQAEQIMHELFQYAKDRKNGAAIQEKLDKAHEGGYGQGALPRQLPTEDAIKYLSTWNSFELDPLKYWKQLNIPCYVVYGVNDMMIPVERSVSLLDSAFATKKHLLTLKVYPTADHYIKTIPDRNNFDFPRFVDGYIEELTSWISKVSK